jgi:hypothetical protein
MSKKWYNLFVSIDEPEDKGAKEASPSGPSGAPKAPRSAAQTVADIAATLGTEPKFTAPVTNPTSFDEIYRAAEIRPPAHGYSILKVADMLRSEHIRNLPPDVKRSSILVALEAAGVTIRDVIEDAVRRDRALDTYERVQQQDVEKLAASKADENRQIQSDMDRIVAEHRARIKANTDQVDRARQRLESWRLQKQQEEQRIAEGVSYFVSENPITTRSDAAAPPRPSMAKES